MRNLYLVVFALLGLAGSAQALADGAGGFPSSWDSYDVSLQKQLESTLKNLGLDKASRNRKLGVTIVDITDLEEPRVASVNGDNMLYAASLPKIAILMGAFVEIEQGNMELDDDTRDSLTRMIRNSSNADATRMLNHVGKERLLEILQSDLYHMYDPAVNGGL
ncbi:MAG: serine hydrolase, partial [Gammaproteobacteria bacterium]|nr:serine hydrolase [Gammaproteobacteria bacterium]